jgi:ABC-2 type transport system ATP-binding protein
MSAILSVQNLSKQYDGGFQALKNVSLDIDEGEILALLGPNGAGKTTLISIICGLVNASSGTAKVGGFDVVDDFRQARSLIGLVPQEIALEPFQTVIDALRFTRGLFGKRNDPALLQSILEKLSLWDKKDAKTMELSGGMKRRVLIAKALCHEPRVLFLDEPTAGVDVELRKDMWEVVRQLKAGRRHHHPDHPLHRGGGGDCRPGRRDPQGELLLVEEKAALMQRMGQRQLRIELMQPLEDVPEALSRYDLDYDAAPAGLFLRGQWRAHRHRVASGRSEQGGDHPARRGDASKARWRTSSSISGAEDKA